MANFHVVPRGDAIKHETRSDTCQCSVEVQTAASRDGDVDVWYYHREVTLEEAVLEHADRDPDPYAEYRVDA